MADMNGLVRPMLSSYADFPDLVGALFQYFKEEEMRNTLGRNYLREFDEVTAKVSVQVTAPPAQKAP